MGRMIQMIDHRCAFLSPAGPFGGAYAIRPYPDGQKMIVFGVCFAVGYEKQAAFRGCYGVGYAKRGAMPAFYCLVWAAHMRATYCYEIQRIITYLGSVLLVALSQINVSFSHTFC